MTDKKTLRQLNVDLGISDRLLEAMEEQAEVNMNFFQFFGEELRVNSNLREEIRELTKTLEE